MSQSNNPQDFQQAGRQDRLLHERVHDPYKSKSKLPEPTVCPACGLVYADGRWQQGEKPEHSHETLCPACHRIQDKMPAGYLTLKGEFFEAHKEEILSLVRHTEEKARREHPIERIMDCEAREEGMLVTFTDAHLARGAGEAIHHAFKGELDFHYNEEDVVVRVGWVR